MPSRSGNHLLPNSSKSSCQLARHSLGMAAVAYLQSPPFCCPARSSRLSNVLENGNGSPGSLAVLYLELAERLSLPLRPVALEGGR